MKRSPERSPERSPRDLSKAAIFVVLCALFTFGENRLGNSSHGIPGMLSSKCYTRGVLTCFLLKFQVVFLFPLHAGAVLSKRALTANIIQCNSR